MNGAANTEQPFRILVLKYLLITWKPLNNHNDTF